MSEMEAVHEILSKALDADERGDKEGAIVHYTNAVEKILKIGDPDLKQRLNKYAIQALDRAEELRGISPTLHNSTINDDKAHTTSANVRSEGSLCVLTDRIILILNFKIRF